MVILKIDIQGVLSRPAECDPVIRGHTYRPAFRYALQTVEVKPRDVHIPGPGCYAERLKDTYALPDIVGAYPTCPAGELKLFKPLVFEATDHFQTVNGLVYSVN